MNNYAVVYEWAGSNYSAYVPDLPGCVSIGDTLAEVQENIKEAIELYLEVLKEDGQLIPKPSTEVGKVSVNI
jgi:predicted RNase H-like HicB family nuclease